MFANTQALCFLTNRKGNIITVIYSYMFTIVLGVGRWLRGKGACCCAWQSRSISRTHMTERENTLQQVFLLPPHGCYGILLHSFTHTHTQIKDKTKQNTTKQKNKKINKNKKQRKNKPPKIPMSLFCTGHFLMETEPALKSRLSASETQLDITIDHLWVVINWR